LPVTLAISRFELKPEAIGRDSADDSLGDSLSAPSEFSATAIKPSATASQGKVTGSSYTPGALQPDTVIEFPK
jgi:hypothetical protein